MTSQILEHILVYLCLCKPGNLGMFVLTQFYNGFKRHIELDSLIVVSMIAYTNQYLNIIGAREIEIDR